MVSRSNKHAEDLIMDYIKDLNDRIRAAKKAIVEAEFAGIRGAEMIALKAELRRLKEVHAAYIGR